MSAGRLDVPSFIGIFHVSWANYELTLEIISQRILKVSDRQAHILFASLNMKAKTDIAISLVKETGSADASAIVETIRSIGRIAGRNHVFHSILLTNPKWTKATFVKREITNGLEYKERSLEGVKLDEKVHELADEVTKLQQLSGVSDARIKAYAGITQAPN